MNAKDGVEAVVIWTDGVVEGLLVGELTVSADGPKLELDVQTLGKCCCPDVGTISGSVVMSDEALLSVG